MAVATTTQQYSLTEFLTLPETKPASECINGQIQPKPMPQGKHSTLQGRLTAEINRIGQSEKLVYAFPELRCTFADHSLQTSPSSGGTISPPTTTAKSKTASTSPLNWRSKSSLPNKAPPQAIEKILFSLQHGSQLGWLIDPDDYSVTVFHPDKLPEFKEQGDRLPVLDAIAPQPSPEPTELLERYPCP